MNPTAGKYFIIAGLVIVAIGVIVYFFGSKLSFFGRLPGDIHIEKENSSFHFPIVTCIVLSVVLTVVVRAVQWFMNR